MKHTVFLTIAIVFANLLYSQAQICFYPGQSISVSSPSSIVSGDFNNDGNADLAIGRTTSKILIYLGNGNGSFVYTSSLALPGSGTGVRSIFCTNLNNDNNTDLVALVSFGSAHVAHGMGNGTFSVAPGSFPGCIDPLSVVTGEFNSDSYTDLFVTSYCGSYLTYYSGANNGSFNVTGSNFFGIANTNYAATTADFNQDGNLDIASLSQASNRLYVIMGQGSNTFSPHVTYTVGTGPKSIASADFNQDGNMDISVGISGVDSVAVLLGSSTGTFASPVFYLCGQSPEYMAARDMNRDGRVDIVITNTVNSVDNLSVLLNNGNGFAPPVNFTVTSNPTGLAVADFNNDSMLDMATTGGLGNSVSVWLSSTPIITGPPTVCAGSQAVLTVSAAASSASSFTWNLGSSNSVNSATLAILPTVSTSFSVASTNSINGCTAIAVKHITIAALPSLTITSSRPTICAGETVTISVAGGLNYNWNIGSASNSIVARPQTSFNYQVTGTAANGCSRQLAFTQTVNICTGFNATISNSPTVLFYPNPSKGIFEVNNASLPQGAKVEIYNSLGELISSFGLHENTLIDLSQKPEGIYIYRVKYDGHTSSGKLIMNK